MIIIANLKGFTLAHPVIVMDNEKIANMSKASVKDITFSYDLTNVLLTGCEL